MPGPHKNYKPSDGLGKYEFSWGATYEGEWIGGRMHGKGTYTFVNGDVFEGEFHEFHIHGKGTFTTAAWSFAGTLDQGRPTTGLLQEFGRGGFAVQFDKGCAHIWEDPTPSKKVRPRQLHVRAEADPTRAIAMYT